MTDTPLWFVRAGKEGAFAEDFRTQGMVGIGWREVGPVSADTPDEEVDRLFAERFPNKDKSTRDVWANQVRRYVREIRIGDAIATYDPRDRAYLLGRIESDVEWVEANLPRRRRVTWTHRVDRDVLSEGTRHRLGSIATLFRVGEEPKTEMLEASTPFDGNYIPSPIAVRGQRTSGLSPTDFDVLQRNQRSVPWPSLPEPDKVAIHNLRQRLLSYAVKLRDELGSTLVLKPFASHTNPSGRNSTYYWSCVFPQTAPNKSFAFQLFLIVRPDVVEIGFGSGSATGEMDQTILTELKDQFAANRRRLSALRGQPWVARLGAQAKASGFQLRKDRLQGPTATDDFPNIEAWINHAASENGGRAVISTPVSVKEALSEGDGFGDRLVRELRPFVQLLDSIYSDAPIPPEEPPPPPAPRLSLEWLAGETLWERADLDAIVESLTSTRQIILAGPPGTSKTWLAELIARYVTQDRVGSVKLVQFHPSYSYEEFVEGLRPHVVDGALTFEPHRGVLLRMAGSKFDGDEFKVLVIDEMNRANLPKVFGELLYLLEYRDRPIDLQYSAGFRLPSRLLIIGTMNTADRSIRGIDVALRRRFDVFECAPSAAVLENFYESRDNDVPDLLDGFESLNKALTTHLDRHHTIGHAFFMADPMDARRLRHIWAHKIGPLVDEYFFDQPDIAAEFTVERFWPSVAREAN